MAIILKNNKYDLSIDSNTIIGVMGNNYDKFLSSLASRDIYYLDKKVSVSNKKVYSLLNIDDGKTSKVLKEYKIDDEFLNKRIKHLSHSEQKLLKYILLVISDKKVNVIDEPFMDLDYSNKKKVVLLINKLIKEKKTVIIGSVNSNIIYSLCKKVLFINENDTYYGKIDSFQNQDLLKKYHIEIPDLVKFVSLAKDKKIKLKYTYDIRDLIKDVYRNVS